MRGLVLAAAFFLICAQPASASVATINSDQVLVIDGKKIFQIGFTTPPPSRASSPEGKNGIQEGLVRAIHGACLQVHPLKIILHSIILLNSFLLRLLQTGLFSQWNRTEPKRQ